jgi:phosphohistidine phosphatase SixA
MLEDAKLWLLRHGIADGKRDENSYADDFVRMLTPKGAKQAIRAGKLLERLGDKPAAVYTSPRVRCLQTALDRAEGCERRGYLSRGPDPA